MPDGNYTVEINGETLEYYAVTHTYLVDGIIVPSITQVLDRRFGSKYNGIPAAVLTRAAEAGTAVHEAIEEYIKTGYEAPLPEVRGFKLLQSRYGFSVVASELPVVLHNGEGKPIAAGRLDLVLEKDGQVGGADIKRTARLDTAYLRGQLNLYRIAIEQSYGVKWAFLAGIHLREDIHKWADIPIERGAPNEIINNYFKEKEK